MTTQPESMADRVRRGRTARGMTQLALAHAAGIHVSSVSRLEQGKETSLETLDAIAPQLQCTVDYLRRGIPVERRTRKA